MNMHLYEYSLNLMIPMHRKFNDDIFAWALVIMKNAVISFIKEYRGPTLRPPCDVIDDVIIMKSTFFGIISWPTLWPCDVINDVMSVWNIICTTKHPQPCTYKILFVWHQSFIVNCPDQHRDNHRQARTQTSKYTGWKHHHLAIAGDKHIVDFMPTNHIYSTSWW